MKTEAAGDAAAAGRGMGWVRLEARSRWEELVLPRGSLELLRSISGDLRFREGQTRPDARAPGVAEARAPSLGEGRPGGLRLLFAGEPGTGKRLAARILAAELGLAIVSVDLPNLFTEDRTETQHRLDRLFTAASSSNAIMYFDGAGAWFGERAQGWRQEDPRSGEDLAALLARVDAYRGVVVFAATLGIARSEINERLDHVVDFPFPDEPARREIWRLQLPTGARLDETHVDFLAASFRLSGGSIQACCTAAAAKAASEGAPVEMRHIVSAVERSYQGRPHDERTREALERFRAGTWNARPLTATPGRAAAPSPVATYAQMEPARSRVALSDRLSAALVVAVVVIAAALGFLIAHRSGTPSPSPSALDKHAAAGPLRVSFPHGWHQKSPPITPRLGLANELAFGPTGTPGTLVIGTSVTTDPSLLPTSLLASLPSAPTPQLVTLAGERFYRYPNLTPRGASGPESVYALPTSIGSVVGVCIPGAAAPGFTGTCERILGTVRVASGSVLGAGPSTSYASSLSAVIVKLSAQRAAAQSRLSAARTPTGQAAAADALASAYHAAATGVSGLSPGTAQSANAAVAAALLDSYHAYGALGSAAARNDTAGYAASTKSVASAASALSAAFAQLAKLGYAVS